MEYISQLMLFTCIQGNHMQRRRPHATKVTTCTQGKYMFAVSYVNSAKLCTTGQHAEHWIHAVDDTLYTYDWETLAAGWQRLKHDLAELSMQHGCTAAPPSTHLSDSNHVQHTKHVVNRRNETGILRHECELGLNATGHSREHRVFVGNLHLWRPLAEDAVRPLC